MQFENITREGIPDSPLLDASPTLPTLWYPHQRLFDAIVSYESIALIRCRRLIPCIPHMVINPGRLQPTTWTYYESYRFGLREEGEENV